MQNDLSILISSCNKFSDLWDENIRAYQKYWVDNPYDTFLVTDRNTEWVAPNVSVLVAEGQDNFPLRIKYALDVIATPYVLVTLDDYFLIDAVENKKIEYLLNEMKKENIQYLSLYNRRVTKKRQYQSLEKLITIDLKKKYALTLYPAIWDVNFLKKTIQDDLSPWSYEVSLTQIAIRENANCQASLAGVYNILDVVRKGKVLHKAQKYFKENGIDIGSRQSISYATEMKLWVLDVISWYMPRKVFKAMKCIARKCGMTFYSDD